MTEPSEEKAAEEKKEKPAGASGGTKAIVAIAIVNLLAVGGLGAYLVFFQKHPAPAAAQPAHGEAAAGEHGEKAEEGHGEKAEGEGEGEGHGEKAGGHGGDDGAAETGPILALEPLVTNLAEGDSDRYLKVTIQLRCKSAASQPEVEAYLVPIRSMILLYLSSLTVADTKGADKKRDIQQQVKRIANEAMPTSRITHVYFTEFVIQ